MSVDVPTERLELESQLLSIMDVLVRAAVTEIGQLVSESSASLCLQLNQSLKDNENLRMRLKTMRSELFSLRLQTRTSRPASRFSPIRGHVPKARVKTQASVVVTPPLAQNDSKKDASNSLQSENTGLQGACADVEAADVILIKDEDDIKGCGAAEALLGQSDTGTTSNLGNLTCTDGELRILSVHGRGEGPLQEAGDTLFSESELRAFSSLSTDHSISHDSLLNLPSQGQISSLQDSAACTAGNGQLEGNQSASFTSVGLIPAIETWAITKSLDCNVCGQSFRSHGELSLHRATHSRKSSLRCPYCTKTFVSKATLTIHQRIHTGEKPYACGQCGRCFTQNGSLKIHLRTHSGEKPFKCEQCSASFNNPSNLRRHMITHSGGDSSSGGGGGSHAAL